uniref:FitA-like ribbon-helix-helix domain-containing protein n=1 Tax=unclassified Rhizobium TaxID=2613769 RepID=UPI001C83C649|nr:MULTISPECIES: plasmid stabilization protein [unclassified Rhizobium]MBX5213432.1 plasmid stabilization protein [Rhizobium sp. NLR9a]MBX5225087.1 plasmid stabilization protein [Rhizobium sp. NLR9b]MBX5230948.1 plasmid stabilization protein [Rhizobium sp. NLR4a]MBX5243698.1 plasmid stabilization protein [Rhizobium sp. NLR3b]MBX5267334.1 plasmid stabilization protein [Rhizobium sp. NLR17b]
MTIRNLDKGLKQRLRVRAATHGRSMEDEARDILRTALATPSRQRATWPRSFAPACSPVGGVELEIPPREPIRDAPDFDA